MANHPLPLQSEVDLDFLKEPEPFVTCFRVTRWPVQIIFSFTPIPAKMIQFETSICFNWVQKGWGGFNHQVGDVIFERNVRFSEVRWTYHASSSKYMECGQSLKKPRVGGKNSLLGAPSPLRHVSPPKKMDQQKGCWGCFTGWWFQIFFYVHP